MRLYLLKNFRRFQRKEGIQDSALAAAVRRAEQGLIDADLGGGLIKQRVARPGQGKSRGYRTILAYRLADRAVFVYGFAKNDQDNIAEDELEDLHDIGADLLRADVEKFEAMIADNRLMEIVYDQEGE